MDVPPADVKATAAEIARQLDETNPAALKQVELIVRHVGAEAALALLQGSLAVEAQGGMMLPDGSRRRTPGGVYLYLAKGRVPREFRAIIWPYIKRPKPPKPQVEPQSWEECLVLATQALQQPGEATTVKIMLIGRPGRIIEKADVVLTTMQNTKPPTLPKGLPAPLAEPTTYIVYIARKQWTKMAGVIQDPGDKLVVEGYPAFDKRLGVVVVFATNVTTKNMQAAKHDAQQTASFLDPPLSIAG
jgi:hypothetical protein